MKKNTSDSAEHDGRLGCTNQANTAENRVFWCNLVSEYTETAAQVLQDVQWLMLMTLWSAFLSAVVQPDNHTLNVKLK